MKNQYVLMALLLGGLCAPGFGQTDANTKADRWRAISVAQHQKGKWLVGAGPTLIGATAKAGKFVANRIWVGVEGEGHAALSDRLEAGVFLLSLARLAERFFGSWRVVRTFSEMEF